MLIMVIIKITLLENLQETLILASLLSYRDEKSASHFLLVMKYASHGFI